MGVLLRESGVFWGECASGWHGVGEKGGGALCGSKGRGHWVI